MHNCLGRKMKLKRGAKSRRRSNPNKSCQRKEKTNIWMRETRKEMEKILNHIGKDMSQSIQM
jgi:hypothetical protein